MLTLAIMALILLPVMAIGLTLVGSSIKWLIHIAFTRNWRDPFPDSSDLHLRLIGDFALGTAAVPVLFVLLNAAALPLTVWTGYGLLAFSVAVLGFRLRLGGRRCLRTLLAQLATVRWELLALVALLGLSLLIRLAPYAPLYVYSGDDVRMYTLLTQSIVTQGHLPRNWDPFAYPAWNVAVDNHVIFTGSESVFALLNFWMPVNTPQLVSAATILFNAAIPFTAYLFVRSLFRDRSRAVAVIASFVLASATYYPVFYEQWGGIDETVGWFVILAVLANLTTSISLPQRDAQRDVRGAILVGGLMAISPIVSIYALGFMGAYIAETLLRRENLRGVVRHVATELGLALLLASPLVVSATVNAVSLSAIPAGSTGWGSFITAPIFQYGDAAGSVFRLITLSTYSLYATPAIVLGLAGIVLALLDRKANRHVHTIAFLGLFLLFLNENGPYGLFLIRYPMWNAVFPDRPEEFMFVLMSIGAGLLVDRIIHVWRMLSVAHRKSNPYRRRAAHTRWVGLRVAVAAALLLSGIAVTNVYDANAYGVGWGASVTSADLAGFTWIQQHVHPNATILVNRADSGSWIPEFAQIRVFPYFELINNVSVFSEYVNMIAELARGHFQTYVSLAREYNIQYAYFGGKAQYGETRVIPSSVLTTPPPTWNYVTMYNITTPQLGNASVRLAHDGDRVMFAGPIVLTVALYRNLTAVSFYSVTVPTNYTFTYVLNEAVPGAPGGWSTIITAQVLGLPVFASSDGSAQVLELNQAYMRTACAPLPPYSTCSGP